MQNKPLREVQKSDLDELLAQAINESQMLDYKSEFSSTNKIGDFLEDVCALANTSGGDLVIGIEAIDGVPTKYKPLTSTPDSEILALDSAVRTGIEPRLQGVEMWPVPLEVGQYVLVVRVPKSWSAPHRTTKSRRFMGRGSRGNYEFDVQQVRSAFVAAEQVPERIRNFRAGRIVAAQGGTGTVVVDGPKMLVHLIPVAAFATGAQIDLTGMDRQRDLPVFELQGEQYRRNLDGLLSFATSSQNQPLGYAQIWRNGVIEAVMHVPEHVKDIFSVAYIEGYLPRAISKYLAVMQRRGASVPVYVFVTFLGFRGKKIMWERMWNETSEAMDRDVADVPELILETFTIDANTLRPLLDSVWNSFGLEKAPLLR